MTNTILLGSKHSTGGRRGVSTRGVFESPTRVRAFVNTEFPRQRNCACRRSPPFCNDVSRRTLEFSDKLPRACRPARWLPASCRTDNRSTAKQRKLREVNGTSPSRFYEQIPKCISWPLQTSINERFCLSATNRASKTNHDGNISVGLNERSRVLR